MLRAKLFLIHTLIIFLIGCSNSSNTEINQDFKYEKYEDKKELTNKLTQEQEEFIKLKENMGDNNYGIKKETFTISDTSHKNMTFKINYPYFYKIYDNEILYEDIVTDDLLISMQKEIFNSNAINNFGVESSMGLCNFHTHIDSDKEYLTIKEITLDDILPISEVEKHLNENKKKLLEDYEDPELEEIASYFGDINTKPSN